MHTNTGDIRIVQIAGRPGIVHGTVLWFISNK